MAVDELANRAGRRHHDEYGDNDGQNHDRQMLCQSDGGDDRIEREDDVKQGDLNQDIDKTDGILRGVFFLCALQAAVDFEGRITSYNVCYTKLLRAGLF